MPDRTAVLHLYLEHEFGFISAAAERGSALPLLGRYMAEGAAGNPRAEFLQYVTAAWSMYFAVDRGDLKGVGDWVTWSLAAEIEHPHEQEVLLHRLDRFFANGDLTSWGRFLPTAVVYFGCVYYYMRRRAAIKDVGVYVWRHARWTFDAVLHLPPARVQPPEAYVGISMLSWAAVEAPDLATELTPVLERAVDGHFPSQVRAMFCQALATNAGRFSARDAQFWARRALDEFSGHLVNEQRTQMLVTVSDPTSEAEAREVTSEMRRCQETAKVGLDELAFLRYAANRSDVIRPFFLRAVQGCAMNQVVAGLAAWYLIEEGPLVVDPERVLLTAPFAEHGYVCVQGEQKWEIARDSQAALVRLTAETNAFLGTATTVTGADNSGLTIPDRPGVPRTDQRVGLQEAMRIAFCPDAFPTAWAPESQLMLPPEGHPVQAVQLQVWGRTWPMIASLKRPRADRPVGKVVLWSGGGTLTEEMELDFVGRCFEAAGATLHARRADRATPSEFLESYTDPSIDVLWVMSHAEFDHWSPHEATLQISQDRTSVSINDLFGHAPNLERRRLLFLNACDAGRFETGGLLPRVGLAPGLAGPEQATISHLWPVSHFPSAAFGAFLAVHLARGDGFFESYRNALSALRSSAAVAGARLEELSGMSTELTQRLRDREEDFSPLEISGSPVFYE